MDELYDKFFQADGIVIGCPVYDMNVTAQLAQFYSRFRSSWKLSVDDPAFFQYKVGAALTRRHPQRRSGERHPLSSPSIRDPRHQCVYLRRRRLRRRHALVPGDGSTLMDDPTGIENCKALGQKVAQVAKALKAGHAQV